MTHDPTKPTDIDAGDGEALEGPPSQRGLIENILEANGIPTGNELELEPEKEPIPWKPADEAPTQEEILRQAYGDGPRRELVFPTPEERTRRIRADAEYRRARDEAEMAEFFDERLGEPYDPLEEAEPLTDDPTPELRMLRQACAALKDVLEPEALERVKVEELSYLELEELRDWALEAFESGGFHSKAPPAALLKATLAEMSEAAAVHDAETAASKEARELAEDLSDHSVEELLAGWQKMGARAGPTLPGTSRGFFDEEMRRAGLGNIEPISLAEERSRSYSGNVAELLEEAKDAFAGVDSESSGKIQRWIHKAFGARLPSSEDLEVPDPVDHPPTRREIEIELLHELEDLLEESLSISGRRVRSVMRRYELLLGRRCPVRMDWDKWEDDEP